MVAGDAMPGLDIKGNRLSWDAPYQDYAGHPRTAGTHATTLRVARENGVPLLHTLAQLSYWSAKHLGDTGLKAMQERGRLQQGMVADITIFDPDTVIEHATFKSGTAGLASTGIPYVLVNGSIVVEDSKVLEGVNPGQPIRFPVEAKGRFEPVSGKAWLKTYTIKTNPESLDIDDSSINPAVEAGRRSHPDGSNPQSRAVPPHAMPAAPSPNTPIGGLFSSNPDGLAAWFRCETHSGNGSDGHGHERADAVSGYSHAALATSAVE